MATLNSLGFPRGFPLSVISAVREDLQRSDGYVDLFLVGFSKDSFNNSAYRLDAFAPPRLRIDVQCDAARATSVSHVVTCNFETSAKASRQAGVHGPEAAEVEGCRYPKFLGRRFHSVGEAGYAGRVACQTALNQRTVAALCARPARISIS